MTFGTYVGINAAVGFIMGVALLVFPGPTLTLAGLQTGEGYLLIARLFGVELIGFNLATWPIRKSSEGSALRATARGHMISEGMGFIVTLLAILIDGGNALLWGVALMYVVFSLSYAYFLFLEPQNSKAVWSRRAP